MNRKILYWGGIFAFFCLGLVLTLSGIFFFLGITAAGSRASAAPPVLLSQGGPVPVPAQTLGTSPVQKGPDQPPGQYVRILTIDEKTNTPLPAVLLFINGLYAGMTAENGSFDLLITGPGPNSSTIRAVKDGYQDITIRSDLIRPGEVLLNLTPGDIIPVEINGPRESEINIVFVPSHTSFNATDNTKTELDGYPGGETQFASDVRTFINQTFLAYPAITSPSYPLPRDYRQRFDFYYFWDGTTYADAFDSCAGTIPQDYWDNVTFSDLTIILYPSYQGVYSGPPGQPVGCTNPNGLGRVYLKISADMPSLAMHEIGHGLYGLMDTYCGDTYYAQNDPDPNLWSSKDGCREYAGGNGWDPDACRQVSSGVPGGCTKEFWRWDPDPDIMYYGYAGTFGNASTKRIVSTLMRVSP
ncbi:hypothetical protein Mboo_0964 [Methanoregula boonei 6A8]|jgi:hypothetical protein|uniref:Uncharacterized protein n=1 Tax=Methanoregula boonei (strain DSM 21154 / JCM 14090 / 6A8) TaxID=456442 RepID=A7I6X1_METB6|nr:hypothetical protein Mboo_0964 [Methanoregula boonei 6A8]